MFASNEINNHIVNANIIIVHSLRKLFFVQVYLKRLWQLFLLVNIALLLCVTQKRPKLRNAYVLESLRNPS